VPYPITLNFRGDVKKRGIQNNNKSSKYNNKIKVLLNKVEQNANLFKLNPNINCKMDLNIIIVGTQGIQRTKNLQNYSQQIIVY